MKAIVYREFGSPDVLRYEEVERPVPADNEVLIQVHAASLNPIDWRLMRGGPLVMRFVLGLFSPRLKRTGRDVAGQVVAVGRKVTHFKPGDEVFGACSGALAEYVCASERAFVPKPANVTFEQAASIPVAGLTALQGLRDHGHIQAGQRVLINGAAGGVGTFAVQMAKWFGAHVTGVCSARNVDMVRSIGADRVIDYTREDFTKDTQRYDLILDCMGNHSLSAYRRVLTPKGRCIIAGAKGVWGGLRLVLGAFVLSRFVSQKFGVFISKLNKEHLTLIGELVEAGKITPVIDRRYTLSEVPEAMRYLERGHARGKVLIVAE